MGRCIWGFCSFVLNNLALLMLKVGMSALNGHCHVWEVLYHANWLFFAVMGQMSIDERALKGLLQAHKVWLVICWCVAHWLELVIKDHLRRTSFSTIDEMLMCAHYVYSKPPKKCWDLEVAVDDLKFCLILFELPSKSILDQFGAYISHQNALIEDLKLGSLNDSPTVNAVMGRPITAV